MKPVPVSPIEASHILVPDPFHNGRHNEESPSIWWHRVRWFSHSAGSCRKAPELRHCHHRPNPPPRPEHVLPEGTSYIQVDVTSAESLGKAFETAKPDVIVHAAGVVPGLADRWSRRLEREVWTINFEGTRNILELSKNSGVQAFIYTSTCCVVIDDTSTAHPNIDEEWPSPSRSTIYGESKVRAN